MIKSTTISIHSVMKTFYRIFLCLGYLLELLSINALSLDEGNSVEIARCRKRPNYEKDATLALDLLKNHNINAVVEYHQAAVGGVKAFTENPKEAEEWVLYVRDDNENRARAIIIKEIKKGLHIILIKKIPIPLNSGAAPFLPVPLRGCNGARVFQPVISGQRTGKSVLPLSAWRTDGLSLLDGGRPP